MKKFFSVLLLFTSMSLAHATDWVLGEQWVSMVERDYREGKYNSFLQVSQEKHTQFLSSQSNVAQSETSVASCINVTPEDEALLSAELEQDSAVIKSILSKYPRSMIHDIVESADRLDSGSQESKDALATCEFGFEKDPDSMDGSAEGRLQKIIDEYSLRQAVVLSNDCENVENIADACQKVFQDSTYLLVLQFEKYRRLMDAVQNESQDLQAMVSLANDRFRQEAAIMHDAQYLVALGMGLVLPENVCEEEIAAIVERQIEYFTNFWSDR